MRIIELAMNDLAQILRDKKSLLFLLLMPVVFTAFMGFAFSQANGIGEALPKLGWSDPDPSGFASQALIGQLEASGVITVEPVDPDQVEQAEARVRQGELAGLVIVPPAFSGAILAGVEAPVTVVASESDLAGQSVRQTVKTAWSRVQSAAEISRLSLGEIEENRPFASQSDREAAFRAAFEQALRHWEDPSITVASLKAQPAEEEGKAAVASGFNQSSPGMIVQFAIFGLTTSAGILVLERKSGTLGRMMTTSLSRAGIIAGHLLAIFLIVFVQEIILVVFGQAAFGVNYLAEPVGVFLVMISLALWAGSLGLFIGVLAKVEDQVILFTMIAMFLISALGGAWFPLEVTGPVFSKIGHLTPGAWAMDGFQNILIRGLDLESVLLPVVVSLGYALLFFGLAVWRFRQNETR